MTAAHENASAQKLPRRPTQHNQREPHGPGDATLVTFATLARMASPLPVGAGIRPIGTRRAQRRHRRGPAPTQRDQT